MHLTNDQLSELVKDIAGKEAVPLVLEIKNKENISEFKVADKLKKTVNEIRNYFYKLHEREIVHFTRKKDKKKGWYVYYWTLDHGRAKKLLISLKIKKIGELRELIRKERSIIYFICPKGCLRVSFENALEINYKCTECNSLLNQEDSSKRIKEMDERIRRLDGELRELTTEVKEEETKKVKKKTKKAFKRLMKKKARKIIKAKKGVKAKKRR